MRTLLPLLDSFNASTIIFFCYSTLTTHPNPDALPNVKEIHIRTIENWDPIVLTKYEDAATTAWFIWRATNISAIKLWQLTQTQIPPNTKEIHIRTIGKHWNFIVPTKYEDAAATAWFIQRVNNNFVIKNSTRPKSRRTSRKFISEQLKNTDIRSCPPNMRTLLPLLDSLNASTIIFFCH